MDGLEIIRNDWAIYDDKIITSSYFPNGVTATQLNKLLNMEAPETFDPELWCDDNQKPYII